MLLLLPLTGSKNYVRLFEYLSKSMWLLSVSCVAVIVGAVCCVRYPLKKDTLGLWIALLLPVTLLLLAVSSSSAGLSAKTVLVALSVLLGIACGVALRNLTQLSIVLSLIMVWQVIGIAMNDGSRSLRSGTLERFCGWYAHPQVLLTVSCFAMPILFGIATSDDRWRILARFGVLATLFCFFKSGYRSFAFPVALSLMFLVLQSKGPSRKIGFITLLCVAALGGSVWVTRATSAVTASSADSIMGRASLQRQALKIFKENPILGTGYGSLQLTSNGSPIGSKAYYEGSDTMVYTDSKNQFLQFAAELGLSGLTWLVALVGCSWNSIRGSSRDARLLRAAWISLLALGLFECPFGLATNLPGNVLLGLISSLSALQWRFEE